MSPDDGTGSAAVSGGTVSSGGAAVGGAAVGGAVYADTGLFVVFEGGDAVGKSTQVAPWWTG